MFATLKGKNSHTILHVVKDYEVGIFSRASYYWNSLKY